VNNPTLENINFCAIFLNKSHHSAEIADQGRILAGGPAVGTGTFSQKSRRESILSRSSSEQK
jgi:hypothetical protein